MKVVTASWWVTAVLLVATVRAERIRYFCDAASTNQNSSGAAMDAGFHFELGVFDAGFTPTVSNRHDWLNHWNAAQGTSYNVSNSRFIGEFEVSDNTAPFTIGAVGWIFGRKVEVAGDEWILFRAADWTWPEAPFFPDPEAIINWNPADADIVLAGQVDGDGSPFLMKSERIRSFAQWQVAALAGEPLDGAGEDPDLDGVANIVEFFSGTDPLSGASSPVVTVDFTGPGGPFLRASYPMDPGSLVVATVEASGGLSSWDSAGVTLEFGASSLLAKDSVPMASASRRFLRLRVELP